MRLRRRLASLAAVLLVACPSTPQDTPDAAVADGGIADGAVDAPVDAVVTMDVLGPPPADVDADVNGFHVHVAGATGALTITRADGSTILGGLPGGNGPGDPDASPHVGMAVRDGTATFATSFGQFRITDTTDVPWRGIARVLAPTSTAPLTLPLVAEDGAMVATLEISSSGAHGLRLHVHTTDAALDRVSFAYACGASEHFLGFGGQSFDVDHRGQTIPIWVEEDGIGKRPDELYTGYPLQGRRHSTHTPMPMFVSSAGYAMMLDTPYRSIFEMCSESADAVRIESWEDDLDLYLLDAATPAEGVRALTELVGRPDSPPDTVLAPWLDAIHGSQEVRDVAALARTSDVPVSAIWTEDFRGGSEQPANLGYALDEDWNIDRTLYPDFETLAGELHDEGYAFLTYNNSFLVMGADVYDEALAMGYSIHHADGTPYTFTGATFTTTSLVDFSSPAATQWAENVMRAQITAGSDGWMADFAEWLPTDAVLASGEDAMTAHNLYPLAWQRANRELLDSIGDGVDRVWFVRSAYLRSQPVVQVVWAGDQTTDWAEGDGFPSVIPIGIGLGMTGFPYYGSDIGGYVSTGTDPTSRELFFRWTELGALSPVMRTHHGRLTTQNWQWNHDAETIAHFGRWARLHQQLFPYLRALADASAASGEPIFRPIAYDHPEFEAGWSLTDEYALGPSIYVAPVVTEGATSRMVTLPPGRYRPLLGGAPITSTGAAMSIAAPLTEIPALVPEGAMIVALPPEVDTVRDVAASSSAVTLASVGDDREIWLYGPGTASFTEGALAYTWTATGWSGAAAAATWNGTPVTITSGTIDVVGEGTLVIDGTATLVVTGGASDRAIRVVLR
ncbi:MAG: glycoside hydrolase family 31 protein [Sandaracinus sp.]